MNYMKQVAKMLGVELGEEFKIKGGHGNNEYCYKFTEHGIVWIKSGATLSNSGLAELLTGEAQIVKLQWKPKNGDKYYCVYFNQNIIANQWSGDAFDLTYFYAGNCFRTKKAALKARENGKLLAKMKKYYDEYGEVNANGND
ncbi:MAG: hypothetical protein DBY32_03965 [Phascolarctobacterium sp.]|nr:MAG: hypothetical protein DBY32_03965 [Phascolarctobacterium sp.]